MHAAATILPERGQQCSQNICAPCWLVVVEASVAQFAGLAHCRQHGAAHIHTKKNYNVVTTSGIVAASQCIYVMDSTDVPPLGSILGACGEFLQS